MRFYLEKPIRVDYYPKTSEDVDEPERLEIEGDLDGEAVCKVVDEEKPVEEEAMDQSDCIGKDAETMDQSDCIGKDAETMEKAIEEVTGDMEEVMKEVVKGKK
ncbi:MAG: hypothetical protein ACOX0L_02885 [Natronincolaceae bacterium]|mgnify:CR=1 FL=1|jgi:hypothetical protein